MVCQADRGGAITSGGGFSSHYRAPPYQRAAVDAYLSRFHVTDTAHPTATAIATTTASGAVKTLKGGFNQRGRGYPDVAAAGHAFPTVIGNRTYLLR